MSLHYSLGVRVAAGLNSDGWATPALMQRPHGLHTYLNTYMLVCSGGKQCSLISVFYDLFLFEVLKAKRNTALFEPMGRWWLFYYCLHLNFSWPSEKENKDRQTAPDTYSQSEYLFSIYLKFLHRRSSDFLLASPAPNLPSCRTAAFRLCTCTLPPRRRAPPQPPRTPRHIINSQLHSHSLLLSRRLMKAAGDAAIPRRRPPPP